MHTEGHSLVTTYSLGTERPFVPLRKLICKKTLRTDRTVDADELQNCLFLAFRPSTFLQRKIPLLLKILLFRCSFVSVILVIYLFAIVLSQVFRVFCLLFSSALDGDAEYGDSFNVLHNAPFFRFVLLHFLILFLNFFQSQSFLYLRKLVINSLMSRPAE